MNLKEKILEYWKMNPVSQRELAKLLNVTPQTIIRILKHDKNVRLFHQFRIEKAIREQQNKE